MGLCINAPRISGYDCKPTSGHFFAARVRSAQSLAGGVARATDPDRPHLEQVSVALIEESGRGLAKTCEEQRVAILAKEDGVGTGSLQRSCIAINIVPLAVRKLLVEAVSCSWPLLTKLAGNPAGAMSVADDGHREAERLNTQLSRHCSPNLAASRWFESLFDYATHF